MRTSSRTSTGQKHLLSLSAALIASFALFSLFASRSAFAQGKGVTATGGGGKDEGYGYAFADDPLSAGGFGPNDATIRVRPNAVRNTLIRPRTSFVPEMLKSVENL